MTLNCTVLNPQSGVIQTIHSDVGPKCFSLPKNVCYYHYTFIFQLYFTR